jgi:biopolymer transport protein ExbD
MQSHLRSNTKLVAEINTVPFTDVVLVLLVIFMVTTPFLFQGSFQVKLPKVAAPSPNLPETITITVAPGDKVLLNDKEVTLDELTSQLRTLVQQKPSAVVMINADKTVTHGSVAQVMSRAYVAGVTKVGIAVEIDTQNSTSPAHSYVPNK